MLLYISRMEGQRSELLSPLNSTLTLASITIVSTSKKYMGKYVEKIELFFKNRLESYYITFVDLNKLILNMYNLLYLN